MPWGRLQALTDLTLWTSSKEEKTNSKKPFPREATPHFPIEGQRVKSLALRLATVKGVEPLDRTILPWRWCLQASTPSLYSSSGMVIASLSPFTEAWGNWLIGMSHTLSETTFICKGFRYQLGLNLQWANLVRGLLKAFWEHKRRIHGESEGREMKRKGRRKQKRGRKGGRGKSEPKAVNSQKLAVTGWCFHYHWIHHMYSFSSLMKFVSGLKKNIKNPLFRSNFLLI